MEDPWAAGPSWAAPKPALPSLDEPARAATPELDVADPWGAPPANAPAAPVDPPRTPPSPPKRVDAFGGGWGEEPWAAPAPSAAVPTEAVEGHAEPAERAPAAAGASPPRSPPEPAGVWSLDSPKLEASASVPLPRSPSPPSLPTLPFLASLASAAASPPRSPVDAAGAQQMPTSPSFGSDFGGFAAVGDVGDPWGGEDAWGAAAGASKRPSSRLDVADVSASADDDEGEGWGGARGAAQAASPRGDDDWEEAQRRMRVRQQRAVNALKQGWTEVAIDVIGLDRMVEFTEDEEQVLVAGVRKLEDEVSDTLRSLASLPPDTNTYPVPLPNLTTYKSYQSALARPANSANSLLTLPVVRRRAADGLAFDLPDYSWAGRSRLGEPDAPQEAAIPEEQGGRWSFWGRKSATPRPLVTSGGGQLEVKPSTPNSAPPVSSPMSLAASDRPMSGSASRAPSIASAQLSRPATPAPDTAAATLTAPAAPTAGTAPTTRAHESFEDVGHTALENPSAVSRFFGRFSRRASHRAQPDGHEDDGHGGHDNDLELTNDDFSFLDQVPSIAGASPPAARQVDDLLALDPAHRPARSLDAVLAAAPRQTTPIAPPPRPTAAAAARTASSSFVPRMKAAGQPPSTSFDLLSGLDFDAPPPVGNAVASSSPQASAMQAQSSSMWDDLLAPSSSSQPFASPVHLPKLAAPSASVLASPIRPAPTVSVPPAGPATDDADDDFGDFGDFGDFSSTSTPHPAFVPTPAAPAPSQSFAAYATPPAPKPALDHTPTLHLLSDASASRGRRWPAPESPVPPPLEPPPKPDSGAFPFFPPPPPGRPASARPGVDLLGAAAPAAADLAGAGGAGSGALAGFAGLGMGLPMETRQVGIPGMPVGAGALQASLAPARAASSPGQSLQPPVAGASAAMGKGLSAQDLSFFDSL